MPLLDRYIFRRIAWLTLMTLVITTVIVLTTQLLRYVNVLTDSDGAIASFLKLAGLLVPSMAQIVLPFAVLIGTAQVLNALNTESELAVMESSGVSHTRIARPAFLLALLLSVASFASANVVEPWANRSLRDVVTNARGDLFRLAIQSGTFREITNDVYVQIGDELPGGELAGIFIADGRDAATDLIYYASRGLIKDVDGSEILFLVDGEIHRKNKADGAVSIISFASYALDLANVTPAQEGPNYSPKERGTFDLLTAVPDEAIEKKAPEERRLELNRRFSEWTYPLAFALIAVCFAGGAQSNREEKLWSIGAAVTIAMALRIAAFTAVQNSGESQVYAALAYALPVGTILLFGWLVISDRSIHVTRVVTRYASRIQAVFERLALLVLGTPSDRPGAVS